ncbi:cytochrome P450 [Thozetella sp. PMI_491]|nr:cytochrome P450 [Thozetella sp. PMI_491]
MISFTEKATMLALAENTHLIALTVAVAITGALYHSHYGPLSHIPGPWYTNWTGLVLTYHWLKGERSHYVHRLHQKYGSVVRISPTEADFCSISAKQQIYTVKDAYNKAKWYEWFVGSNKASVFAIRDPEAHRRLRRHLSGPLSESSLKEIEPVIRNRVDLTIEKLSYDMKMDGASNILKWFMFMTTDIIGLLSFGISFNMLEDGKENQYVQDIENFAKASSITVAIPRIVAFLHATRLPVPFAALKRATENDPDDAQLTLFTKAFRATDNDVLTIPEIHGSAMTYLIAGSDTSAHTLTYLVWSVCRAPVIRDRLVREVQGLPANFAEHNLRGLPYLNQVIDETLRLYSAAPSGLPREVSEKGAHLCGYYFKGGLTVSVQAYSMHRDPKVFPCPEVFDPSRWETATKEMNDSFMPFGGGARICIGIHLARIELRLATALFFRAFPSAKISTKDGMCDEDMTPEIYFLLTPKKKRCLVESC